MVLAGVDHVVVGFKAFTGLFGQQRLDVGAHDVPDPEFAHKSLGLLLRAQRDDHRSNLPTEHARCEPELSPEGEHVVGFDVGLYLYQLSGPIESKQVELHLCTFDPE